MGLNTKNTIVTICNSALIKIGGKTITSIDDPSKEARLCREQYRKNREALLLEHPWNFAKKRVLLTPAPESEQPAFGFENSFVLPSDCLRVIATSLDDARSLGTTSGFATASSSSFSRPLTPVAYEIEQNRLVSNDTEVGILYISNAIDESLFTETFAELLALRIAADICFSIVESRTLKGDLKAEYDAYIREIRSYNGQEGGQKFFLNEGSEFLTSRF